MSQLGGGLVERIGRLGLERAELAKEAPRALIGGAKIPYRPQDLAAVITLLSPRNPKAILSLEVETQGGAGFLQECLKAEVDGVVESNKNAGTLRTHLRALKTKYDAVVIDGRGLALSADIVWKYLLGGKDTTREFGKGAPADYGPCKMAPGCVIVLNFADAGTKTLYFALRSRYSPMFSSPFLGVVGV